MGRASGRKNLPRAPQPGTPEGDEIGLSARQDPAGSPIPGLTGNIVNYETVRREPPIGDPLPEFRGMMAHGVPPEDSTTEERATMEREGTLAQHRPPTPPQHPKPVVRPTPVPVYLVEEGSGGEAYLTASPRHISVPGILATGANAADPVRLCGKDAKRNRIGLLNEDTANNVRFAQRPSDLVAGGGSLLPYPSNTYLWLETQDELFAYAVGSASVILSIIDEFEQEL
jgi:hypothetical protein